MSISEISSYDEQIFEALDLATQDREKGPSGMLQGRGAYCPKT